MTSHPRAHQTGAALRSSGRGPDPAQDTAIEFSVYVDPSGVVVDGFDHEGGLPGATVTLLSSEAPIGPFAAVANGSNVMSAANRTNPDVTDAAGEFGWDTEPGYYQVEASRPGCGTAETEPFQVPPPVTQLRLVLFCTLRVDTTVLPQAKRGTAYQTTLRASGQSPPFKWKKLSALPKGLKLSNSGVVSGTPSIKKAAGNYSFEVRITDQKKRSLAETLTLHVS